MQPYGFLWENARLFVVPRGHYMEFSNHADAIQYLRHRLRLRANGRGTARRYPTLECHRWECPSCRFRVQLLSSWLCFRVRFHRGFMMMSHLPGCPRAVEGERFARGADPLAHALWPLPTQGEAWAYGIYRRGPTPYPDLKMWAWDGAQWLEVEGRPVPAILD